MVDNTMSSEKRFYFLLILTLIAVLQLSKKWASYLVSQPEAGMGYQFTSVFLLNRRRYDHVLIDSGFITRIGDSTEIPLKEEDIFQILVTNKK